MIDIDFIRRKIYKPDENELKIMPGDEIPIEVMNILKDGHYKDREECFGPGDPKTLCVVHLNCTQCGDETKASLSKTATLAYLNGKRAVLCDECKRKADEVKRQKEEKQKKEFEQSADYANKHTQKIIDQYINTMVSRPLSKQELVDIWNDIHGAYFHEEEVASAIKALPYRTFLQTPYWKAVSYEAKRSAHFCCHVCNSNAALSTHHKTYEIHGYEHTYWGMNQLIVLCQDCHSKFHDKLDEI